MQWVCIESYACPHMPRAAQSMRNPATFHNGHAFESKFACKLDGGPLQAQCLEVSAIFGFTMEHESQTMTELSWFSESRQTLPHRTNYAAPTKHWKRALYEALWCLQCLPSAPAHRTPGHLQLGTTVPSMNVGFFRKCRAYMSNFETIKLSNLSFHNCPRNGERIDVSAIATAPSDL